MLCRYFIWFGVNWFGASFLLNQWTKHAETLPNCQPHSAWATMSIFTPCNQMFQYYRLLNSYKFGFTIYAKVNSFKATNQCYYNFLLRSLLPAKCQLLWEMYNLIVRKKEKSPLITIIAEIICRVFSSQNATVYCFLSLMSFSTQAAIALA